MLNHTAVTSLLYILDVALHLLQFGHSAQVEVISGSPQDVNKVREIQSKPNLFYPQMSCSDFEVIVRRKNNYKAKPLLPVTDPQADTTKKRRVIHNKAIRLLSNNW